MLWFRVTAGVMGAAGRHRRGLARGRCAAPPHVCVDLPPCYLSNDDDADEVRVSAGPLGQVPSPIDGSAPKALALEVAIDCGVAPSPMGAKTVELVALRLPDAPHEHPLGRTDAEELEVLAVWELVHAAQQGDTAAFGALYDRYVDMVFRFVLYRVGDRLLAEDLTSETFLRALRRITSVTYQGKDVGAWFVTIARNLVLDHVKSSRYRLEVTTSEFRDSDSSDDPEAEVVAGAVNAALLECVSQLGEDQRECIGLRFLQGLSVAETAVIMGRNEGAVKALQHRAIRRLASLVPAELR